MYCMVIITTTDSIPGHKIVKYLGLVWSSTARSKHLGWDLIAMGKALVGGEISSYRKMMNEGRNDVARGLAENAKKLGANAVIGMRLGTTQIMPATLEIFAYGTAVLVEKEGESSSRKKS